MPRDRQEHSVWQDSMGDRLCTSLISSPRKFARALAEMTVCQLGPQCRDVEWTARFGEHNSHPRSLRSQTVFHGPVVYTDDVYREVSGASSDFEKELLRVFTKHHKYRDEREYRFFIFSDAEPIMDCMDLRVPPEVMATIKVTNKDNLLRDLPTGDTGERERRKGSVAQPKNGNEADDMDKLEMPWDPLDPLKLLDDPSVPVAVEDYTGLGLPDDLREVTSVYGAVQALHQAVERVSADRRVEVASSAWFAEAYIRRLCAKFENPIAGIAIADSNDIVIGLAFPHESQVVAASVVSPQGTAVCLIQRPKGVQVTHDEHRPLLGETTLKRLAGLGMVLR